VGHPAAMGRFSQDHAPVFLRRDETRRTWPDKRSAPLCISPAVGEALRDRSSPQRDTPGIRIASPEAFPHGGP
jgi:hypothetical protein